LHLPAWLFFLAAAAAATAAEKPITLLHHNHPPRLVVAAAVPGAEWFLRDLYEALADLRRHDPGSPGLLLLDPGDGRATAPLQARDRNGADLLRVARTRSAQGADWLQDFGEFATDADAPLVLATHARASARDLARELARIEDMRFEAWPSEPGAANGGGNVEALPDGIALVGNTAGPGLRARVAAAYGAAMLTVDTGWLEVGHVDEILSSVLVPGMPCGFALVRASPALALEIPVGDSPGDGMRRYRRLALRAALRPGTDPWRAQQVLERQLAAIASAVVARVKALDARCAALPVIALPVLYECDGPAAAPVRCRAIASNPVNMVVLGHAVLTGATGVAAFDDAVRARLAAAGQRVYLIDDRHQRALGGGVHCAVNVLRDPTRRVAPAIAPVRRAWPGSPPSGP